MPTTATHTYSSGGVQPAFPKPDVLPLSVKLKASTTFPAGCILAALTAAPTIFVPYATGGSDGSQIPLGILKYGCTTDSSGNFSLGEYDLQNSAPAYFVGTFRTEDLPQSGTGAIDAGAPAAAGWRLLQGTVVTGILSLS